MYIHKIQWNTQRATENSKKYGKKYKKHPYSLRKGLDRGIAEQYNDEVCVKVHFVFMHISNKTFSATTF